MKRLNWAIVLFVTYFLSTSLARAQADVSLEKRIDDLLSRMTLDEKLGQMSQNGFPGELTEQVKNEIRAGRWGSFYGRGTPEIKTEMQRIAMNESRLKIPLVFGADLIHGFHTTFPIPLAESCTWNPELVRQAARITAHEAAREDIHWTFSPMMDICRDARWGRIAETLGEDPYLSGQLAAAMTRGYQGDTLSDADSIAACGKHYVGYGAAEGGRDYNTTWIPEPLLHDVYLAPFHAAKGAGIASFMSAFNDLNGVPASGNAYTLRHVLRDEWKFDGVVVSDYAAVKELIPHGYAADDQDAAKKSIEVGVDMEMVSKTYFEHGKELIASGELDPKLVDDSVRNILRMKLRLGLFGDKGRRVPQQGLPPSQEGLNIAQQLAQESLVLLKNTNDVLPLSKTIGKIAVIGPLADSPCDQLGSWTVDRDGVSITPLASLRKMLGEDRVVYAAGLKSSRDMSQDGFDEAIAAANGADVVLLFLGEEADMSGEASSRAFINLPGAQEELVNQLAATGKPIIAVIMAGRPLTFHDVAKKMNAILWSFHPGSMGGPAIADTLFGDTVPSGKLTVTFPRTVGQEPLYYNHMNTGRPADNLGSESENHYSSKYIDVDWMPEYPFGFGLSYTRFEYSQLQVADSPLKMGGTIHVSAIVKNTGQRDGCEIVQLYIHQLAASFTQPVRELKGFQRVDLKAGESKRVEFALDANQLAFHDAAGNLRSEPGKFEVWIAPDSASGEQMGFRLISAGR